MNKTVKVVITLTVFTLVVLYFLQACGGVKSVGNSCTNFNQVLLTKTAEYFNDNLPSEEGTIKAATISELIAGNKISLTDLKEVGTDCSGNVYVSRSGGDYYYSTDVTCGTCSTSNLYTAWSDWTDTLPSLLNSNSQIQTGMFYNYGKGELEYSDWSDWALNLEDIKGPTLPEGVTVANTEKEEKTQYSYRDGSFKWYKLTGAEEPYNKGEYLESSPGSAYSKDTTTKKVSRPATNTSKSTLTSSLNGLVYDAISSTTGYRMQTPKYIYTYNKPTSCSAYKPYVKCYKTTGTYTLPSCTYNTSAEARAACNAQSNVKNCDVSPCSTTVGGSTYDASRVRVGSFTYACYYASFSSTATIECSGAGGTYLMNCVEDSTYCGSTTKKWKCRQSCATEYTCPSGGTLSGSTCVIAGTTTYTYKYTNDVIEYKNSGQLFVQGTCPTDYSLEEVTSSPSPECVSGSTIYTPFYLKADGTETTNKSLATPLSDAQFESLLGQGKGINYSKSMSDVSYEASGNYAEGTCPSGTKGTTCSEVPLYKTTVYKFKWYKSSTSSKTWCNDGEYLTKSSASGCQPDIASANWGEWSEFSDTKVNSTTTRQVKTQIMKRIRKSYMGSGNFYLDDFLQLDEFEAKVGKTLAELSQDTSLIIQKKIMYKYRMLKE